MADIRKQFFGAGALKVGDQFVLKKEEWG